MFNQIYPFGGNFNPLNFNPDGNSNVKLSEDQYEVYVNGDFAGRKTLHNQGDSLSDIDDFLRMQGLTGFSTKVEGDHYLVQSAEHGDDIANVLSVYFNNR